MTTTTKPKFRLGQILATPGALNLIQETGDHLFDYIKRHASGDWGDLCAEDKRENARALKRGNRLLSAYTASNGEKLWVITEANRSVTTILLPDEY